MSNTEYAYIFNHWGHLFDNLGFLNKSRHYFDFFHKLHKLYSKNPLDIASSGANLVKCLFHLSSALPNEFKDRKCQIDELYMTGLEIMVSLYGDLMHFKKALFMNRSAGYLSWKGEWDSAF